MKRKITSITPIIKGEKMEKYRIDMYSFYNRKIGQKTVMAYSEEDVHSFVYSKNFKHKRKDFMRGFSITKVK